VTAAAPTLLVDTSVLVSVERTGRPPEELLARIGSRLVSVAAITASELLHGVHRAGTAVQRSRREHFVETALSLFPVLPFDLAAARVHAAIWADLASRGEPIGAHDLQIAATALAAGLALLTVNQRHFDRVAGLEVELWR
jgi:tRNA(fMet)-specific endonuclease VapC